MKRTAQICCVLAAFLFSGSAFAEDSPVLRRKAIRAAKRVSVHTLDSVLPDQQFVSWFRKLVGPVAKTTWDVNDCGEQSGSPGDTPADVPMCVAAQAELEQASVTVSIAVGTFEQGVFGKPGLFYALVERDGIRYDTIKLSALPGLISSIRTPNR